MAYNGVVGASCPPQCVEVSAADLLPTTPTPLCRVRISMCMEIPEEMSDEIVYDYELPKYTERMKTRWVVVTMPPDVVEQIRKVDTSMANNGNFTEPKIVIH